MLCRGYTDRAEPWQPVRLGLPKPQHGRYPSEEPSESHEDDDKIEKYVEPGQPKKNTRIVHKSEPPKHKEHHDAKGRHSPNREHKPRQIKGPHHSKDSKDSHRPKGRKYAMANNVPAHTEEHPP